MITAHADITRRTLLIEGDPLNLWETGIPVNLYLADDGEATRLGEDAYISFGAKQNSLFTGPLLAQVATWTRPSADDEPYTGTLDLNGANLVSLLSNFTGAAIFASVLWENPAGQNRRQTTTARIQIRNALQLLTDATPTPSPLFQQTMLLSIDLDESNVAVSISDNSGKLVLLASGGEGGSIGQDLTAIEALTGTGILKRTGTNAWALITLGIADITALQTALDGKQAAGSYAAATHTHAIADVTDLQTALDGKSATGHTHTASQVTDFNSAADARITAQKAQANGLATLGADSKIPTSQLPALAISETSVVASQVAMLALTAQTGDVAVRSDLNKSFILAGSDPTVLGNWQELLTPTDTVLSVNGQTGAITLTTSHITEGSNQYFTSSRADARITAAIGSTVQAYSANLTAWAGKTAPAGAAVGTSDTQTLTGKTIDNASNTVTGEVIPFGVALSNNTEAATGTGLASFTVTRACKIASSSLPLLNAGTAPSGSTLIVDINKNGSSIFSTRLTLDSGETNSGSAATAAVLATDPTPFARGDIISFDLDKVGAVTPGAGIV